MANLKPTTGTQSAQTMNEVIMRLYFIIGRLDSVALLIDYADKDEKFSKAVTMLNESSSSLKEITEDLPKI